MKDVWPGDLWWDKNKRWSTGDTHMLYLALGKEDPETWAMAEFLWCGESYCGANTRYMREKEINEMEHVGNIHQIKRFD